MTSEEYNNDQEPDDEPQAGAGEATGDQHSSSQEDNFLADADASQVGLVAEFVDFLKYNKKWWMTPILLVLALIAVLVVISATGGAPFLYAFW